MGNSMNRRKFLSLQEDKMTHCGTIFYGCSEVGEVIPPYDPPGGLPGGGFSGIMRSTHTVPRQRHLSSSPVLDCTEFASGKSVVSVGDRCRCGGIVPLD
jgi:hypothetical protein